MAKFPPKDGKCEKNRSARRKIHVPRTVERDANPHTFEKSIGVWQCIQLCHSNMAAYNLPLCFNYYTGTVSKLLLTVAEDEITDNDIESLEG